MGFLEKIRKGLSKTKQNKGRGLSGLFAAFRGVDDEFFDELEERLILADVGVETSMKAVERLRAVTKERKLREAEEVRGALREILVEMLQVGDPFLNLETRPAVLLVIGVNGVGKTTTIGKIANEYAQSGRKPMIAAADTFRAAAAEQLGEWANRAGVPMVRHQEGADPAAVVFDAIASYRAKGCDLLLVDTAGRLHNKKNLMNELSKIRRVIARELPDTPCEVLLVLDATTGQNAVAQAEAFLDVCELTGVILTKLDGTAKGGVTVQIADTLHVPVRFIGVGEGIDDLKRFEPNDFAEALLDLE